MDSFTALRKKYIIGIGDVDFLQTLKISSLFNLFQEIAGVHADQLGFGIDIITANHGVTWVLVKIKVEIERLPLWNEEIEIETWPQRPKRFEFERDYIVRDTEGNILVRAISSWVIMDIKTRELRKTELIHVNYPDPVKEERAIDGKIGKLKPYCESELVYKKTVGYSDIDLNEHLNNSKYIDYIMDCFTCEEHKKYKAGSIQVSYVNEALPGETIALKRDINTENPKMLYIEGINDLDGRQIFSSLIEVEPR